MNDQDLRDLRQSVSTINDELGKVWKAWAEVSTDVKWLKDILRYGFAPTLVGIVILLVGILLKLLLS